MTKVEISGAGKVLMLCVRCFTYSTVRLTSRLVRVAVHGPPGTLTGGE
jgi:hypothetical protein